MTQYLIDMPNGPAQSAMLLTNVVRRERDARRIFGAVTDTSANKAREVLIAAIRQAKPAEVVFAHDPDCETLLATANEAARASQTAASYHASLNAQLKVDNERLRTANKRVKAEWTAENSEAQSLATQVRDANANATELRAEVIELKNLNGSQATTIELLRDQLREIKRDANVAELRSTLTIRNERVRNLEAKATRQSQTLSQLGAEIQRLRGALTRAGDTAKSIKAEATADVLIIDRILAHPDDLPAFE